MLDSFVTVPIQCTDSEKTFKVPILDKVPHIFSLNRSIARSWAQRLATQNIIHNFHWSGTGTYTFMKV